MKLEVGMYVRTKDKKGVTYIRKLTKLADEYPQKLYGMEVDKEIHYVNYLSQKNILKASHNIIDLIEVGDYVNGYKVFEIDRIKRFVVCGVFKEFEEKEIETIVTKEQFESMSYKVED